MLAFDADVLIYAASPGHPFGRRVLNIFSTAGDSMAGIGSVLLIPETLVKPNRSPGLLAERIRIESLLSHLDLRPCDAAVAAQALALGAIYGLKAIDAVHLATAVHAGADIFISNNRRDFPKSIEEIAIAYPEDLPDPARRG